MNITYTLVMAAVDLELFRKVDNVHCDVSIVDPGTSMHNSIQLEMISIINCSDAFAILHSP